MQWFEVDRVGLSKLMAQRGKAYVLYELIQNAWDQKVTHVHVGMVKNPGDRYATITVEDDDPDGFMNLTHAFTLFAESTKKADATKRGRFNLGEKLVLALCEEAEILSTTGGVRFDHAGRHMLRRSRAAGSIFTGRLKMTNTEFQDCVIGVQRLIAPSSIVTTFTVQDRHEETRIELPLRERIASFEATLPTEVADEEGVMRRSVLKTTISVYQPREGEVGTLFEMGIPVVETGDSYDVDIGQKVPLNFNRDNVSPAYLRDVRTLVLNAVHAQISDVETANASWVRDALKDGNVATEAVETVVKLRFGDRAVAYDPSDQEANSRVVSAGYTVVHGPQFSKEEWSQIRRTGLLRPAGQVMPTPRPFSNDPNATPVEVIPWDRMTVAEQRVITSLSRIACVLLGFTPEVTLVKTLKGFAACYGNRRLTLSQSSLKTDMADCLIDATLSETMTSLLIHELGHQFCDDHLRDGYHEALCDLGAKLAHAIIRNPKLLRVR